jgi:hypothetical protein
LSKEWQRSRQNHKYHHLIHILSVTLHRKERKRARIGSQELFQRFYVDWCVEIKAEYKWECFYSEIEQTPTQRGERGRDPQISSFKD